MSGTFGLRLKPSGDRKELLSDAVNFRGQMFSDFFWSIRCCQRYYNVGNNCKRSCDPGKIPGIQPVPDKCCAGKCDSEFAADKIYQGNRGKSCTNKYTGPGSLTVRATPPDSHQEQWEDCAAGNGEGQCDQLSNKGQLKKCDHHDTECHCNGCYTCCSDLCLSRCLRVEDPVVDIV